MVLSQSLGYLCSHQFKTNMNIIFFKKALQGFQTSQICDTQAYVHHLISLRSKRFQSSYCAKVRAEAKKRLNLARKRLLRRLSPDHLCQPEEHRFWKHKILLFHLLCIQTTETMFVMHHYLVPGFFLWEKPWGREVRVASQRSCDGKERSCVFHIF